MDKMNKKCKKFAKKFIFLFCLLLCLYNVGKCIEKLVENPTTTVIYFEEFGKQGVPSLTVCAYSNHLENSTSYKKEKLAEHGLSPNDYIKQRIWTSNSSDTSPEDLYEEITWNLEDLVDRIEYTLRGNHYIINETTTDWQYFWTETRRKWEGRCFTFNSNSEMSFVGLSNVEIISKFPHDLVISYHGKSQTMDEDLSGISFLARHKQFYTLKVPVHIIKNRNTVNKPCSSETENFDQKRNTIAVENMMEDLGCVVPFIERNKYKHPICINKTKAKIAEDIFEGYGPYYDLYNLNNIPLPCKQMHADPIQIFESPEWDGQTWVNAMFARNSRITEQQAAYSFHSLYAEVGGFVGLLLGISVYQLGSLIDIIPDLQP